MAATDLCSVADVRDVLQKPDEDEEQDAIIGALVVAASLDIMDELEREFAPATTGVARKFEVGSDYGDTILSLAPFDLRSVTTVKLDTDLASPYTLSASEYRLYPKPSRFGTYTSIRLRPQSVATANWFPDIREVEITGNWGFATVPANVKLAAAITAADWFRRDVAAFSTTFSAEADRFEVPRAIPSVAIDMLQRFRRHSYA